MRQVDAVVPQFVGIEALVEQIPLLGASSTSRFSVRILARAAWSALSSFCRMSEMMRTISNRRSFSLRRMRHSRDFLRAVSSRCEISFDLIALNRIGFAGVASRGPDDLALLHQLVLDAAGTSRSS